MKQRVDSRVYCAVHVQCNFSHGNYIIAITIISIMLTMPSRKPPPPTSNASGALLRSKRRSHKLTQQELADRIGVTQSVVAGWESGDRQLERSSYEVISRLQYELEVTSDELRGVITTVLPSHTAPRQNRALDVIDMNTGQIYRYCTGEPVKYSVTKEFDIADLEVYILRDSAMTTIARDGDYLHVNRAERVPLAGHHYVIRDGANRLYLRHARAVAGRIVFLADDETAVGFDAQAVAVIGRAVHVFSGRAI